MHTQPFTTTLKLTAPPSCSPSTHCTSRLGVAVLQTCCLLALPLYTPAVKMKRELFQVSESPAKVDAYDLRPGSTQRWSWEVRFWSGRAGGVGPAASEGPARGQWQLCEWPPSPAATQGDGKRTGTRRGPWSAPAACRPLISSCPDWPQVRDYVKDERRVTSIHSLGPFFKHYQV